MEAPKKLWLPRDGGIQTSFVRLPAEEDDVDVLVVPCQTHGAPARPPYKPFEPREAEPRQPKKAYFRKFWAIGAGLLGLIGKAWLPFPRLQCLI